MNTKRERRGEDSSACLSRLFPATDDPGYRLHAHTKNTQAHAQPCPQSTHAATKNKHPHDGFGSEWRPLSDDKMKSHLFIAQASGNHSLTFTSLLHHHRHRHHHSLTPERFHIVSDHYNLLFAKSSKLVLLSRPFLVNTVKITSNGLQ